MSPDTADRLLEILRAEERVYLEMRDLLQRERELMVTLDPAALGEVARDKEALADEGRLVEESRVVLAAQMGRELGLGTEGPPLSQLCEALGAAGAPLREAHTRLVVLASVVRELLDANAAFAGDHLARIRTTLQLLGRLLPGEESYAPVVGKAPAGPVGQLVRRSA